MSQSLLSALCIVGTVFCCAPTYAAENSQPVSINANQLSHTISTFHTHPNGALKFLGFDGIHGSDGISIDIADVPAVTIRAPKTSGIYKLHTRTGAKNYQVNVVVLHPLGRQARSLSGYRIGRYPAHPKNNPSYRRPRGLIQATPSNITTYLSPHFQLSQFLCKQQSEWPKFLTVDHRLLAKLEALIDLLHQQGIPANTLHVMSGYRTPSYNKSLGNAKFSRHIYGDAADIFVDINKDGTMDDLNGDGQSDIDDAHWLLTLVEANIDKAPFRKLAGGLGAYPPNRYHGAFVHIDARGTEARWGSRPE